MQTVLDIVNESLVLVGDKGNVSNLDSTSDERAMLLKRVYNSTKNTLISSFTWSFARKRAILSEISPPAFGFSKAFQLPSDCLVPLINEASTLDKFEIEQKVFLTNSEKVNLIYTAKIESVDMFTEIFKKILSLEIACKICLPLTSDLALYDRLEIKRKLAFKEAKRADSMLGTPESFRKIFIRR